MTRSLSVSTVSSKSCWVIASFTAPGVTVPSQLLRE